MPFQTVRVPVSFNYTPEAWERFQTAMADLSRALEQTARQQLPRSGWAAGSTQQQFVREEHTHMAYLVVGRDFENVIYNNNYSNAICHYLIDRWHNLDTSRINYVNAEKGMLSFLPAGREYKTYPDGSWSRVGRQVGKPGRVVRMLIPKDDYGLFSDADVEQFTNLVKAADVLRSASFVRVSGEKIKYWYDGDHYAYGSGTLDTSCMRHSRCRNYFGVYTENPDIVSLLCLIDKVGDTLLGRALVWEIPGCETPIMDRVYGSDSTKQAFRDYAEDHGWYSRAFHSYEHETEFIKNGETVHLDISVQLPVYRFPWYPYLDTLKYFDWHTGTFANTPARTVHAVLMNTRGEGAPWNWATIPHWAEGVTLVREVTPSEARELQQMTQQANPHPQPATEPNWDAPAENVWYDDDDNDDDDDDDAGYDDPPPFRFWQHGEMVHTLVEDPDIVPVAPETVEWAPPQAGMVDDGVSPTVNAITATTDAWFRRWGGVVATPTTMASTYAFDVVDDATVAMDEAAPLPEDALDRVREVITRSRWRRAAQAQTHSETTDADQDW